MIRSGIPTSFQGCEFRSMLEARWAAFFDLLGWRWEYEPCELRGYIPDFFITNFKNPLLVEVKPEPTIDGLESYSPKIIDSGWTHDFLIVGCALHDSDVSEGVAIGLLSQRRNSEGDAGLAPAILGCGVHRPKSPCQQRGLVHSCGGYDCYRCGIYDGNVAGLEGAEARETWNRAGTIVKWRPR